VIEIDWSVHDRYPENTLTCACGEMFRSHSKAIVGVGIVSRKPCPRCGETQSIRSARSDPERYEL